MHRLISIICAALVTLTLAACAHPNGERRDPSGTDSNERPAAKARPPKRLETMSTSKTTQQMFKPEGLKKLQAALSQNLDGKEARVGDHNAGGPPTDDTKVGGNGKPVEQTNKLDRQTQLALQAYQKSQGLPETGLPDYETLRRLGLKPEEVFEHELPAERHGVK